MTVEPKKTRSRKASARSGTKTNSDARKTSLTRKTSTARKAATTRDEVAAGAVPDGAAAATPPASEKPVVVENVPIVSGVPEMKRQELIAKVMERVDIKKKDAKPVIEALLAVLGEALSEGRELNLNPLGKVKLNRMKDTGNGRILIAKIRQAGPRAAAPDKRGVQEIADAPQVDVAQERE